MSKRKILYFCFAFVFMISAVAFVCGFAADGAEQESDELFSYSSNVREFVWNSDIPQENGGGNGIRIAVRDTDCVVKYLPVINLNALDSQEDALIGFQALYGGGYSELAAEGEDATITLRITDIYDATNYLTVTYEQAELLSSWNYWEVYMRAGYGGSEWGTLGTTGTFLIEQGHGQAYGTVVNTSFYGQSEQHFNCYYDAEEKSFYAVNNNTRTLIIDLDDPAQVGDGKEWKGFTTGEVYLQLEFPDTVSPSAIVLTELAGQSFAGATSRDTIADTTAPAIRVKLDEALGGKLPDADIGSTYPIPEAAAYDVVWGERDTAVRVLNEAGKEFIPQGGRVLLSEEGNYFIEYTATDGKDNLAKTVLPFRVREIANLSAEFASEPKTATVGTLYKIPEIAFTGGSGPITYSETVKYGDAEVTTDEMRRFFLGYAEGVTDIRVSVRARDYISEEESVFELSIPVEISPDPILTVAGMPQAVYTGKTITFPAFEAVSYAQGEQEVSGFIFVNGTMLGSDRKYVVREAAGSILTVEYIAGGTDAQTVQSYSVQVRDAENIEEYFLFDPSVTAEVTNTYTEYTAKKETELEYANPLAADSLDLLFGIDPQKNHMSSLDIVLTDSLDPEIELFLRFTPHETDASGSWLSVNGNEKAVRTDGSFGNENQFHIVLRNRQAAITNATGDVLTVLSRCASGERFSGFLSGAVKLSVRINGVTGESGVRIYRIGNQTFSQYGISAGMSAQLVYDGDIVHSHISIGEEILIPAARAYDVLDFNSQVRVSLIAPSGDAVYDRIRADRTLRFRTAEYGTYVVRYHVEDASGNRDEIEFYIDVYDRTPPEVVLNGSVAEEFKRGDTLNIPTVSVVDDRDGINCSISVYLVGIRYESVAMGDKVKLNEAGRFRLLYYVSDSSGNVTTLWYNIRVK